MAVSILPGRVPSPLIELADDRLDRHGVRLWLKRDDLIHAAVPGNKWRKLKYNLAAVRTAGQDTVLTFGGAYSHHIAATAVAGDLCGLRTIGVIRGEEHSPLNPVLAAAGRRGMRLAYLDRTTYREKDRPEVVAGLRDRFGDFYLVPEGGSNAAGVRGCQELGQELSNRFDLVCCPVGSGGTLAGLAAGVPAPARLLGVSVLRGEGFLDRPVVRLQADTFGRRVGDWRIAYGFDHGGYAKRSPRLTAFVSDFAARHRLRLEPIYVAKMLYAVFALVADGGIPAGSRVVAVVTGPAPDHAEPGTSEPASPSASSRSRSRSAR